ncbi:MAG: hypothetical protein V4510_13090, partial [bacterium]
MLTAFQCETGAYMTENGELLCEDCARDDFTKPVSRYELSCWNEGGDSPYDNGDEGHAPECYCDYGVTCDGCGAELEEAFTTPECEALQEE